MTGFFIRLAVVSIFSFTLIFMENSILSLNFRISIVILSFMILVYQLLRMKNFIKIKVVHMFNKDF